MSFISGSSLTNLSLHVHSSRRRGYFLASRSPDTQIAFGRGISVASSSRDFFSASSRVSLSHLVVLSPVEMHNLAIRRCWYPVEYSR
jgi:hypothetical protein